MNNGCDEIAKKFFKVESEINLLRAIESGNLEEVKKLVEEGVSVNVRLDSKKKLGYYHNVNENDWGVFIIDRDTPLHLATKLGNYDIYRFLLNNGADINANVCRAEALEIVVFLIKLGVDMNKKNPYGDTPLANTMNNGRDEIAKVLIMAGAIIDSRNNFEETPLHKAASQLNGTIVHTLIDAGADVNLRNGNGETPLIIAAMTCVEYILEDEFDNKYLRTLELLLKNAGDIDLEIILRKSAVENNIQICRPIIQTMIKYFVLQQPTINKPEDIHLTEFFSDWWNDCQSQVHLMQSQNLGKSDISLYRFVTQKPTQSNGISV
ncbi:hypothetical protein LAZ67_11002782 [Cordylochernes scorpioides]|uniref:Ankyrin repeat protein n=1 Tax=Cordylochernes scorpioides TaxID=51811 RepID=A0ABY6KZG4_9ARAC|nr:hypothetical protein LAZ67_11002782 [Cordylochernes scorpioides]